ncbi:hypothetical protein, partial [Halomarina rubra]
MRYLRCRLRFSEDAIHPVHAALGEDDTPSRDLLWQWNRSEEGDVFLYSVDGDVAAYEEALQATPLVEEHELTAAGDERHYVFVRQAHRPVDEGLLGAMSRAGVLVVPPVVFNADATASLTVVGESTALRRTVESVPAVVDVDIERVGEYAGHPGRF